MTTPTRLERSLPSILGDLAAGPTPDYIDDVLAPTAQRAPAAGLDVPRKVVPHG